MMVVSSTLDCQPLYCVILSLESRWNVILLIISDWSLTSMISTSIRKILMVPKNWCVVDR